MTRRRLQTSATLSSVFSLVIMGVLIIGSIYVIGNYLIPFTKEETPISSESIENEFSITDLSTGEETNIVNIPPETYTTDPQNNSLYIVQLGAFNNYNNAIRLQAELLEKGYPNAIITEGPPYKVQLGASQTRYEADQLKEQFKNDGYLDVFIVH